MKRRGSYEDMVDKSVWQTMQRSVNMVVTVWLTMKGNCEDIFCFYTSIAFLTISAVALSFKISTNFKPNSREVPGPLEVIKFCA